MIVYLNIIICFETYIHSVSGIKRLLLRDSIKLRFKMFRKYGEGFN